MSLPEVIQTQSRNGDSSNWCPAQHAIPSRFAGLSTVLVISDGRPSPPNTRCPLRVADNLGLLEPVIGKRDGTLSRRCMWSKNFREYCRTTGLEKLANLTGVSASKILVMGTRKRWSERSHAPAMLHERGSRGGKWRSKGERSRRGQHKRRRWEVWSGPVCECVPVEGSGVAWFIAVRLKK